MAEKDYSKGKIYKVFSPSTNLTYIGSTILTIEGRFSVHKYGYKNNKPCYSKIIFDAGDAEIILIHLYPCESLAELSKEEGRVMKLYPDRVNKKEAGLTTQEQQEKENKFRRENQGYKNIKNERRRNMSQEQRDEINKHRREYMKNMSQEKRDKINKQKRELYAKKKEEAKNKDLVV